MVEDFNRNMTMMLMMGVWITFDDAMSAYQPRTTKTGLPNMSFIKRKPKPLGTEGKTACESETGVLIHCEIQEGRDAMRLKEHAPELDYWFRLHIIMANIHVTDCWKLSKHHLPRHHPPKESNVVNFADLLCKALVYNGLT
eukprot:jgi/Tetstr1/449698/TSEL_036766.t1